MMYLLCTSPVAVCVCDSQGCFPHETVIQMHCKESSWNKSLL